MDDPEDYREKSAFLARGLEAETGTLHDPGIILASIDVFFATTQTLCWTQFTHSVLASPRFLKDSHGYSGSAGVPQLGPSVFSFANPANLQLRYSNWYCTPYNMLMTRSSAGIVAAVDTKPLSPEASHAWNDFSPCLGLMSWTSSFTTWALGGP